MILKILKSVKDFEQKILDDEIKVCFLHENSKVSKKGWSGFVKPEELYLPENLNNNLGISLIGPKFPGDNILTCIDIDGDKRDKNLHTIEQFSKDWLYKIITAKLNEEGVKYMAAKSSSGGYHIYLYTLIESFRYESTKGLRYPKDMSQTTSEDLKMFLSAHPKEFTELIDDDVPKSIVEIWCNKRYMVAPGSDIYNQEGEYIGTVELLSDGVQSFGEISTLQKNLNDIFREALIENGFKEDSRQQYQNNINFDINNLSTSSELDGFSIEKIGDLLVDVFPKIDGQKHNATLALGGYLFNKNISLNSVIKLGEYVINNTPEGLFNNNQAFIDTLTHDIREQDPSRNQTGLPTFEEILSPYYSKEVVGKKLHLATNPIFHKFWPDGRYSKKFDEIIINHKQNYTVKNIIQTKLTNDGDIIDNVFQSYRLEQSIEEIIRFDDISDPEDKSPWEYPTQIIFQSDKSGRQKSPTYQNATELFRNYRKLPGTYTDHAKSIIESVYREYESLDFIKTIKSSTKPGIWFDSEDNKIRKFIRDGNEIIELPPKCPTKKDLTRALKLLQRMDKIIPWEEGKFGFLIKTALTLPYAHILKYYFDKAHPCIILHGEAGTLKTTIAELIVNINIDSFKNKEENIISGGELLSEYRFGRAMNQSSYPLVVNETEYLFSSPKIRELIKDAVTGKLIRKPGGNTPVSYYSHRASIYTMNNIPIETEDPAYLRRFIPIEFDRTERGDVPQVLEKLKFFNKNGVVNGKFKELTPIGDYIYYLLNNNIDWFNLSIEKIQDNLIESMETFTQMDLSFLKQQQNNFFYVDRTDQENTKLSMLLEILRKPYLKNKARFISKDNPLAIVRNLVDSNTIYPYVHKINDEYIIMDTGLKNKFNYIYSQNGVNITLKTCYNLLLDLDLDLNDITYTVSAVEGRKKKVRGIKMTFEDFTKILTNKRHL